MKWEHENGEILLVREFKKKKLLIFYGSFKNNQYSFYRKWQLTFSGDLKIFNFTVFMRIWRWKHLPFYINLKLLNPLVSTVLQKLIFYLNLKNKLYPYSFYENMGNGNNLLSMTKCHFLRGGSNLLSTW